MNNSKLLLTRIAARRLAPRAFAWVCLGNCNVSVYVIHRTNVARPPDGQQETHQGAGGA